MDPRNIGERLDGIESLDRVAQPVHRVVTTVLPRGAAKDALHGVWLGHPLHPMLTDLPIGFWTGAFVLDLVGGRRSCSAADAMVALGVVTALPTAVAGWADWSELGERDRRTGVVHAAANVTATALYGASFVARRRGRRFAGVLLGIAGATAATGGAYLGGHLTFRRAAGVSRSIDPPSPSEWSPLTVEGPLTTGKPCVARLDGEVLAAVDTKGGPAALYSRCSHLGGPLHEGDVVGGCLRCPWHGSRFRIDDGTVERGPATATLPAYQLRRDGAAIRVRRRPPA